MGLVQAKPSRVLLWRLPETCWSLTTVVVGYAVAHQNRLWVIILESCSSKTLYNVTVGFYGPQAMSYATVAGLPLFWQLHCWYALPLWLLHYLITRLNVMSILVMGLYQNTCEFYLHTGADACVVSHSFEFLSCSSCVQSDCL